MTESEQAFLFFWNKFGSRLHDKVRKVGPEPPPVERTSHLHVDVPDLQVDERELLLQSLRDGRRVLTRSGVGV